jgi:hypothetical protein
MLRSSVSVTLLLTAATATAASLTGTANQRFCQVIIATCAEGSEDTCRPEFSGSMSEGQSFTSKTGRLCYKRDRKPGDCGSGLQPYWNCATHFGNPNMLIQ